MKAWMLLSGWLAIGLWVGLRARREPWERALVVAFWPFFLVAPRSGVVPGPVARLRAALGPEDPAMDVVVRLAEVVEAQRARLERLDVAVAEAGPVPGDDEALAQARRRSRELLVAARDREGRVHGEALAAVEEAATRLWLLREQGHSAEVEALLRGLVARVEASSEVHATSGQASG